MSRNILILLIAITVSACTTETLAAQSANDVTAGQRTQATKPEWQPKNVGPLNALVAMGNIEGIVILDVRTSKEFNSGHIPSSINIDFYDQDFQNTLSTLPKNTPYLIYCRSGRRSTETLKIMEKLGFSNVTHLDGGINAWRIAEFPLIEPCQLC